VTAALGMTVESAVTVETCESLEILAEGSKDVCEESAKKQRKG